MRVHLRGVPLTVTPGAIVTFKVSLHNGTDRDAEVRLPTSKRFDLAIRDPADQVVFDAHRDHLFLQVVTPLRVAAGEEQALGKATYQVPPDAAPGTYHVQARVTTLDGQWAETVAFDVTPTTHPGP